MAKATDKGELNIFAERLREIIKEKGYTHEAVAKGIGVTRQGVGKWVSGDSVPDVLTAGRLAIFLNVSVDYLSGNSDIKSSDTDLKAVCDHMGLSEIAVKTFREVVLEAGKNIMRGNFTRKDIVSKLLESLYFYELIDDLMDIREASNDLTTLLFNLSDFEKKELCQRLGINYEIFEIVLWDGLEDRGYQVDYSEVDVTRYKIYRLIDKISDVFDMRTQIEKYSRDELFDKLSDEIYLDDETIKQLIVE